VGTDHGVFAGGAEGEDDRGDGLGGDQRGWDLFKIIGAAVEALGGKVSDIIRTRMFVTDVAKWEEVAKVHGEVFADIRPATSIVQVAKLIDRDAQIEIEADAVLD
jgi:enamine deaminase RidA (YjgF/YER057c/UK114 family)